MNGPGGRSQKGITDYLNADFSTHLPTILLSVAYWKQLMSSLSKRIAEDPVFASANRVGPEAKIIRAAEPLKVYTVLGEKSGCEWIVESRGDRQLSLDLASK